jgi:hypothetical protein
MDKDNKTVVSQADGGIDDTREPASVFYQRLSETGVDAGELEAIIREQRRPHEGITLIPDELGK